MQNECGCVRYEVHESLVSRRVTISTVRWEDDVHEALKDKVIDIWRNEVNQQGARHNGLGGNKLRTYAKFKTRWGYEEYLSVIDDFKKRTLLSKFRMGICPLRIESGRYEGGTRLPLAQSVGRCCDLNEVEDEAHFL